MRYMLRIPVGVALLVACLAGRTDAADAARAASSNASPKANASNAAVAEKLVRDALEAELAGNAAERARLLEAALKEDPELTAARWQSGQIKVGKSWLSVDEVAQSNSENGRLAEYRRRRDSLVDTADSQRELARWCQRSQLTGEAAVHWQAVLSFAPDDAEAIRALKLKPHNGRLLNPRELAAARAWEAQEKEAARKWQPQIIKWRDAIVEGNATERQAAIEGLKSIRDPAAIGALRGAFLRGGRGTGSPELYGAYVEVLAQMPEEPATQELLRCVLAGDSQIAAAALKGRPLASYVPQLIAALPSDVKLDAKTSVSVSPTGWVFREHEFTFSVPDENYSNTHVARDSRGHFALPNREGKWDHSVQQQADYGAFVDFVGAVAAANRFRSEVSNVQSRLDATIGANRERIHNAILASTAFERSESREGYAEQLIKALESYSPARMPETGPRFDRRLVQESFAYSVYQPAPPNSCFPAGTPVETQLGSAAIETLKPGDRVLSQNAETGELAYQAVRGVTLRPAVPLVEIEAGGETIRATRGHPFWVNGQGWRMAKHLQAGQYLHTPDGPLAIERIGEQPAQEAYNLVVSDFATYFVGPPKILVHDNQPLAGTGMLVPGLAARDVKP